MVQHAQQFVSTPAWRLRQIAGVSLDGEPVAGEAGPQHGKLRIDKAGRGRLAGEASRARVHAVQLVCDRAFACAGKHEAGRLLVRIDLIAGDLVEIDFGGA